MLVEGHELSLMTVAAYIDLNPVRAGLVLRPEDYRWSGYAENLSGTKGATLRGVARGSSCPGASTTVNWRRTGGKWSLISESTRVPTIPTLLQKSARAGRWSF